MHTYPCATHVRALSVNLRPSRQEGEAEDGALKLETGGRRESTLPHPPIPTDQVLSAKSIRESGPRASSGEPRDKVWELTEPNAKERHG